jgi:hypothetical protein
MDVAIINGTNGRMTVYKPAELIRDARAACRGKGKLESYFVRVQEGGGCGSTVSLVVQYRQPDGWSTTTTVAI